MDVNRALSVPQRNTAPIHQQKLAVGAHMRDATVARHALSALTAETLPRRTRTPAMSAHMRNALLARLSMFPYDIRSHGTKECTHAHVLVVSTSLQMVRKPRRKRKPAMSAHMHHAGGAHQALSAPTVTQSPDTKETSGQCTRAHDW